VTLFLGLGTAAVVGTQHQDWLGVVPRAMTSQMVVLAALVAFGAILQWRVVPAKLADDPRVREDEYKQHQY
jgi:hypothetical protein